MKFNIVHRLGFSILLICALAYGGTWLFNHVNPWISIVATAIVVIMILGMLANPIIKYFNQQDEKNDSI
jgi:membrane protein YdbS with pleckstrin-like domain